MAKRMTGTQAMNLALNELMEADSKIICLGEDIGKKGGAWGYFSGLFDKFGRDRVIQTPICENGYSGIANGMAYGGFRPICEYMYADFATLAFDEIVNVAAKARYSSNGTLSLPITFMMPGGGGKGGSNHSQSVEAWFANVPGLKLVAPTTPADLRRFLKAAVLDDDPVVFLFARLAAMSYKEEVDETDLSIPSLVNAAKIIKEGSDLTVISWHRPLLKVLKVVEEIEKETGKSIEIIDPRVLMPFDSEKVFQSVKKTGKLLVVHEAPERGGFGTLISAWVAENCLGDLKAPVARVGGYNTCTPFGACEEYAFPQVEEIRAGILRMLK